ncbi:trypsin-like serine protease [Pendulispora brunnea]|uniref:Trypsin-like serine protease n=1 Tax=Pendulispora brunnea TaxID=2905690 RepID=A0ABZ2K5G2_9BACT
MKTLVLSLVAGAMAAFTMGCTADTASSSEADNGRVSEPIIGGTTDSGDPSVVGIVLTDSSGSQYICTGSVISSTKVLTARHCIEDMVSWEVRVGTNINSPTSTLAVSKGAYSPDGDIGVLTLSRATSLTPLPYNTGTLDSGDIGASVRAVGYGSNKTNSGSGTGAGTKRTGNTTIRGLQVDTFSTYNVLCHGDSGGPIFENGTIIGITSYGNPANCTGYGYSVRTDLHADFIQSH